MRRRLLVTSLIFIGNAVGYWSLVAFSTHSLAVYVVAQVFGIEIGNVARWFALIWVFLIVGFLIGPETKGRPLAELDGVDPRAV